MDNYLIETIVALFSDYMSVLLVFIPVISAMNFLITAIWSIMFKGAGESARGLR